MSVVPVDANAKPSPAQFLNLCGTLIEENKCENLLIVTETGAQQEDFKAVIDETKVKCTFLAMDEVPYINCGAVDGLYVWSPTKDFINKNPEIEDWFSRSIVPLFGAIGLNHITACKYKIQMTERGFFEQQPVNTIHVLNPNEKGA